MLHRLSREVPHSVQLDRREVTLPSAASSVGVLAFSGGGYQKCQPRYFPRL